MAQGNAAGIVNPYTGEPLPQQHGLPPGVNPVIRLRSVDVTAKGFPVQVVVPDGETPLQVFSHGREIIIATLALAATGAKEDHPDGLTGE